MTTSQTPSVTNSMLAINDMAGQEIQSGVNCVAYAIDNEKIIFAAFFGAETAIEAVKALSWTKGFLHMGDARIKAKTPLNTFTWHRNDVPSLNKACNYIMSKSAEMVLDHDNCTYVMDMNPLHSAPMSPETIELIGQRIGEICNVSVLQAWFPKLVMAAREYPNVRSPLVSPVTYQENCRFWRISTAGEGWADLVRKLLQENKLIITRNAK